MHMRIYVYTYIGVQADGNTDIAPLVCRPPAPVEWRWRLYILLYMHGSRPPRACPRTPTGTHARTNTDTHAYVFSVCVLTCIYVYMHMYAYVCLHLRFFSYAMVCYELQTHRQTRTYMHTHARKHICAWVHCGGGWVHGGRQYIYIYIT